MIRWGQRGRRTRQDRYPAHAVARERSEEAEMRRIVITFLAVAALAGFSTGPASAAPSPVTATPGALAFGAVPTGQSVTMTVTFTNHGSTDLWFTGWTICPITACSPDDDLAFSFDSNFLANDPTSCAYLTVNSPPALPAGESCATAIAFSPTNQQPYRAVLVVIFGLFDGDYAYTLEWPLFGRGI
jgi:hypothetical protein